MTKAACDSSTYRWESCEYPQPARWRTSSWLQEREIPSISMT